VANKYNLMSQLIFKFPFKTQYYEQDYYVSSNNFSAYQLIESWPNWPDKCLNIYGPKGSGKTHLSKIFIKKIKSYYIQANDFKDYDIISNIENKECLIIDNFKNDIEENEFYSILNFLKQSNKYIIINSLFPIKNEKITLKDLKSRLNSFIDVGIELPTDDLLMVIISKYFSDKQIEITPKISEFIIKNIERSYEKVFKFTKEIDDLSLSSGKSININLIKKVLINE
jgi:chromosomal replication initiation ATPase DnaA